VVLNISVCKLMRFVSLFITQCATFMCPPNVPVDSGAVGGLALCQNRMACLPERNVGNVQREIAPLNPFQQRDGCRHLVSGRSIAVHPVCFDKQVARTL
jgi:hypothetical protein